MQRSFCVDLYAVFRVTIYELPPDNTMVAPMHFNAVLSALRSGLRLFGASERGNVMLTFALATVPIIAFVGAAVDYSRGNSAKAAMQSAIDATGLILSKTAKGLTQEELNQKSREVFLALFHRPEVTNLMVTPHYTTPTDSSFKLEIGVTGTVPTTFTKIIGQETMDLSVSTEIAWGLKKLELALALDVTGSMASNNKMTELKKAAKSLLTTLKGAAKKDGDIKVAIVPFAVVVNAGAANVAAASLDWSDWSSEPAIMTTWLATQSNKNAWERVRPGSSCPFTTGNQGFQCTNGPAGKTNESTVSTIPTSGTYSGLICPSKDNGSKSTAATGLLSNRYYSGCYSSAVKANTNDWHPVATGSSASCGSLSSNDCQCTGSGSNKVCAFRPQSNWQSLAKGSSMSCGSLASPSVCECSGSGNNKVCRQKAYDHVWRPSPKTAWDGCVRDRNQNFDVENTAPSFVWSGVTKTNLNGTPEDYRTATTPSAADAFQPFQYSTCPAALQPLTSNWTTLETKIDELAPAGNTNVTIGLSWAFQALTPSDPLAGAAAASPDLKKVVILLTDGDNTQNRWSTSQTDIDARTRQACEKVKGAGIELWTIRVINGNASLLQACATQPSSTFYKNVSDAAQLNDVFADIAKALTNLRIAR
jgi:Flp pilus assembly protein TadG